MLPCFIAITAIMGCSKSKSDPTPTPVQKTVLKITVTDGGNLVPGASVKLYGSQSDMQNNANALGVATTDNAGVATFTDILAIKYYFYVQSGCKDNFNGNVSTASAIIANSTNTATVAVSSVGQLKMVNTSNNPYQVYVNGVLTLSSLAGNTSYTLTEAPAGNYTIRVVQLSGYVVTPTDKTYTGTLACGGVLTTTFP